MLADNVDNSLEIRCLILAMDNSKRAGQYTMRVAEGYPNPLIPNIKP
jgi:hypothetical protein